MDACDLNEKLLTNFPELADELNNYMNEYDGLDTGAFLTYEDVFRKHIETAVRTDEEAFLKRTSEFLEDLMATGDEYACNVVTVGVLEGLKANCKINDVRAFLYPKCLAEFEELDL